MRYIYESINDDSIHITVCSCTNDLLDSMFTIGTQHTKSYTPLRMLPKLLVRDCIAGIKLPDIDSSLK